MQHLTIQTKLLICLLSSMIGSAVLTVLEYTQGLLVHNLIFLVIILSVYLTDIVLGMFKHWKLKDFSFKDLVTHAMLKIGIGFASMLIFNAFGFVLQDDAAFVKTYFILVGKLLTLTYYAGSAFNSMSVLTGGKFPPLAWMERMKEFNKTLNPKTLTQNDNQQ